MKLGDFYSESRIWVVPDIWLIIGGNSNGKLFTIQYSASYVIDNTNYSATSASIVNVSSIDIGKLLK